MIPSEQLRELFDEHLPAQQAKWLRARLDEADRNEAKVAELDKVVERLTGEVEELQEETSHLTVRAAENKAKYDNLADREAAIAKQEADLAHRTEIVDIREKHAKARVEDHRHMVGLVFRNTELRRSMTEPRTVQDAAIVYKNSGDQVMEPAGEHIEYVTTETAEEAK